MIVIDASEKKGMNTMYSTHTHMLQPCTQNIPINVGCIVTFSPSQKG